MAKDILTLKPEAVWRYFYDLTQIPRPTGQMDEVTRYVFEAGKKLGLETLQDEVGNVLIRKPATPGMEKKPIITLQGHVDMVPQKNSDVQHDFAKDPIDAYIDGEWVTARGTTLGADNGIGVALALAILEDNSLKHGPLEALFTINEEVGMDGANGLKPGFCKGDILLNIDSEVEGNLYIGCAGGIDVNVSLEYKDQETTSQEDQAVRLTLSGLKGGHSGVDIHIGRANANKLMARFLKCAVEEFGVRVASLEGCSLRNAIPLEAFAVLTIAPEDAEEFCKYVAEFEALFTKEFDGIEDKISLKVEKCDMPTNILPEDIQDNLINALEACQNGPISMLQSFPDTVESSTNLAVVRAGDGLVEVKFLVRSSSDSRKMWVASSIESAFLLMGAKVELAAPYTGWQPNAKSHIMEVMSKVYEEIYHEKPDVKVMHAGLECGIIQGVMPDMDMISFGPEIRHPHSPDEKVHIDSVARTYEVIVKTLELV